MEVWSKLPNAYDYYSCNEGHKLEWCGDELTFSSHQCANCSNNYNLNKKSVVRWSCPTCNQYYCQQCRMNLKCKKCPINHEYTFNKGYHSNNFTCDLCFKILNGTFDVWFDSQCNLGFCIDCVGETESLTEEIYMFED
jgi:hypothetical protein